ncbi:MAG: bifunctional UDP-sugar hydrolase/5'-nucleotidase [Deltaproteobacteria bacterium]|nr:bifunctional UDP-sugar hydrolase/5'-nucleotidase [Deltaproteobacteria bacterium]
MSLFFLFAPSLQAEENAVIDLTILHINDTHGHSLPYIQKSIDRKRPVGGAAYLAKMISVERTENPGGTLLLSAGDMFQGTPISNLFRGKPVIELMNDMKFDAMTVGNHEFDWGLDVLKELSEAARFPFLSANIDDRHNRAPPWIKPYVMMTRQGLKIAVIGITTPETNALTKLGRIGPYRFLDPEKVLPERIRAVKKEGARFVILLSHQGLEADIDLARSVKGIHVIVGGDSHTAVKTPVLIGKTIVVQAGCCGHYLGVLKLEVDTKSGRILKHTRKRELRKVLSGPDDSYDEGARKIVSKYHDQIKEKFSRVVGETAVDLVRRPYHESNIGNLVCDAMKTATGAAIAFQNSGGIRTNIPKGRITLEQVHTLLPFDNLLISVDLTGEQILKILEQSATLEHGILQVSGLRVVINTDKPGGSRVRQVTVGDHPLEPKKLYRVTTNDFLAAGGDKYASFKEGKHAVLGEALRDGFIKYLREHSPVNPRVEGRIVIRP